MSKWNCGLALGLCLSVAGTASAQNKTLTDKDRAEIR